MNNYGVIQFISSTLLTKLYAMYLSLFPLEKVAHLINQIGIISNRHENALSLSGRILVSRVRYVLRNN